MFGVALLLIVGGGDVGKMLLLLRSEIRPNWMTTQEEQSSVLVISYLFIYFDYFWRGGRRPKFFGLFLAFYCIKIVNFTASFRGGVCDNIISTVSSLLNVAPPRPLCILACCNSGSTKACLGGAAIELVLLQH